MKKLFIIIAIIILIICLFPQEKEEMRIRVIANSNSSFDQKVKIEVAKEMKNLLKTTQDLDIIRDKAEYVISKYECLYRVNVRVDKQRFPTRHIGDKVIPGGVYNTLIIELGKAEGKNYWSMLYPDYFNVSFEDVNSGDVEFGWWLLELLGVE